MSNFAQGMGLGAQAVQFGIERADRRKQANVENARQSERDMVDRLDREVDRKRKDQLFEQFNVELAAKRDEAARYVEASGAFDRFNAAASLLDSGNPAALDQYATVTKQYLPTILKHEGVSRKWEAADRVFKQGQAFTNKKIADTSVLQSMEEAARLAPEVMINPPKLPDGTPDFASIRETIATRRQEIADQQIELRRAAVDARMEAEASGAYGGRSRDQLPPGTKVELDAVGDELRTVNKALAEPKLTPDRKLELINRKSSLQRRIRSFDNKVEPRGRMAPGTPAASSSGTENKGKTTRVGDFTVRQLD